MRLATVKAGGEVRFGAVVEGGFIDLGPVFRGRCSDLAGLLEIDGVAEAARHCRTARPELPLEALTWLPPNPRLRARMFALGVAYKDHQLETGRADAEFPSLFSKLPQSMVGHLQPMVRPRISDKFDFEGEIVIVIGKAGRHIPVARALDHVAGYTILVDGSVRDWQKHSVVAGKNFDASSACGPWITTRDEIPDWRRVELTTRLNGQQMQHSAWGMLMWDVEFVVHYVSTFTRLEPGDAISTGTPAGVGHRRDPQLFMKAGDVLEVEVSGMGTLRNTIVDQ